MPSNIPELTTQQVAINRMLSSIGERPVNDIDTSQRLDVILARTVLNEVHVQSLTRGWWFNAEEKIELTPNASGELMVPADVIKVDAWYKSITKFVKRGLRLYNKETRSYTDNTSNLYVNWVKLLTYDDCPESYKMYVAARAGVVFQKRSIGSMTLFEFTKEDEHIAFGTLLQEEADQEDSNLTTAPDQFDLNHRR
jgi:hypothetical protein